MVLVPEVSAGCFGGSRCLFGRGVGMNVSVVLPFAVSCFSCCGLEDEPSSLFLSFAAAFVLAFSCCFTCCGSGLEDKPSSLPLSVAGAFVLAFSCFSCCGSGLEDGPSSLFVSFAAAFVLDFSCFSCCGSGLDDELSSSFLSFAAASVLASSPAVAFSVRVSTGSSSAFFSPDGVAESVSGRAVSSIFSRRRFDTRVGWFEPLASSSLLETEGVLRPLPRFLAVGSLASLLPFSSVEALRGLPGRPLFRGASSSLDCSALLDGSGVCRVAFFLASIGRVSCSPSSLEAVSDDFLGLPRFLVGLEVVSPLLASSEVLLGLDLRLSLLFAVAFSSSLDPLSSSAVSIFESLSSAS
mmetsp:Transcript_27970/g.68102  ORF Transcript_27970/g.68102 Transcript_27970/m.68102 type:complete len:353 (-) Transcript_27970:7-1065(-)